MSLAEIQVLTALPVTVLLLIVVGFFVFLMGRLAVEKAMDASFERLASRAAFAEKIHDQQFTLVLDISKKLEKIRSQLQRLIENKIRPELAAPEGETKELTEVYEDLRVIRVILGAKLSSLLEEKADVASVVASRWQPLREQMSQGQKAELDQHWATWGEINNQLSETISELFSFPTDTRAAAYRGPWRWLFGRRRNR